MVDNENHKSAINLLSEIGAKLRCYQRISVDQLIELKPHDSLNRIGPTISELTNKLSDDQLIDLIYGTTYVERKLTWSGGSHASVVFLFRLLVSRNVSEDELNDVSAWVIRNTNNSYNPFGSSNSHDAKNYSEYIELTRKRSEAGIIYITAVKEKESLAHNSKKLRAKMGKSGWTLDGSPSRKRLYDELNELSILEQLTRMVEDKTFPPEFYPIDLARAATSDVIKELSKDEKEKLLKKMTGKYVGPWEAFRKRLQDELIT